MKKLILLIWAIIQTVFAQNLNFDSHVSDAIDKWVLIDNKVENNKYILGFIYVDMQAGITFHYEGTAQVKDNTWIHTPAEPLKIHKSRLSANSPRVHILTNDQISSLSISSPPDWLSHYKSDLKGIAYWTKMGRHFNHVTALDKSIPLLEKAYAQNPHFDGLEFELAFAYNASKQFEKAIEVLIAAIQHNPNNFWYYRELGFSYSKTNQLELAEEAYHKGISMSTANDQNAEMAINMVQAYFLAKDRPKFDEWCDITRKYAVKGSLFDQYVDYFTNNWGNQ